MYSFTNSSALGFDLARVPGGAAVASVLLHALGERDEAAAAPTAPTERRARRVANGAPFAPMTVAEVLASRRRTSAGPDVSGLGDRLAAAPLGTLDDLKAFVSREVYGWEDRVGDLATRAPSTAADVQRVCRLLEHAWAVPTAVPAAPALGDLGPQTARLGVLLDAASGLSARDVDRLTATGEHRAGWSRAMHDATIASDLCGRLRAGTMAQLHLVLALRRADLRPVVVTCAWNALSGVAAGLVVEDLLGADALEVLVEPHAALLGLT